MSKELHKLSTNHAYNIGPYQILSRKRYRLQLANKRVNELFCSRMHFFKSLKMKEKKPGKFFQKNGDNIDFEK